MKDTCKFKTVCELQSRSGMQCQYMPTTLRPQSGPTRQRKKTEVSKTPPPPELSHDVLTCSDDVHQTSWAHISVHSSPSNVFRCSIIQPAHLQNMWAPCGLFRVNAGFARLEERQGETFDLSFRVDKAGYWASCPAGKNLGDCHGPSTEPSRAPHNPQIRLHRSI